MFLDEIGDLPLELQPKLLRALQEQEFERLGGSPTIRVNVRVVAATSQNLAQLMAAKQFRADLYYRLDVIPIYLPPLRERVEDIPLLVEHFVRKYSARFKRPIDLIPDEVIQALKTHDWPGNIRELQNIIERALVFSPGFRVASPASGPEAVNQAAVNGVVTHFGRRGAGVHSRGTEGDQREDWRAVGCSQATWLAAYHAGL